MIQLNNKDFILFITISIIEYLCISMFFNSNTLFPKLVLLISIIYVILRFNTQLILINSIYILSTIIIFYKISKHKIQEKNDDSNTIENFTSKLKEFQNKEKFKSVSSSLNTSNLKRKLKKKKEEFREDDYTSFEDYKDDFKSYKFTRKTKSTSDALNKLPFYIEKFKELW
jgi:hypothetical protein